MLYNDFRGKRILAYEKEKKSVSKYDQINELPNLKKELPELKEINAQTLQDVPARIDKAFQGFFRRCKEKKSKAGFPRYKPINRYNSFTLTQSGWKLNSNYLTVTNIGRFKLKLSRPIQGNIKTIIIKRISADKWYVLFACDEVPKKLLKKTNKEIALDMGCISFATDSNGKKIKNPKFFKQSQKLLKMRQQRLSRRKRASAGRRRAKVLVAKTHEKIENQRRDFQFKLAKQLVQNNDIIYIEKMKAWNSFRRLNKSMRDSAWFQFFNIIKSKAEEAGKEIISVSPENTSQVCSQCGKLVKKNLSVRVHNCPSCGLIIDRDFNAAINIMRLGQSHQALDLKITYNE